MKKGTEIELHSEKVRSLLGEIPSPFLRWGTVIIVVIILVLLLVICIIPYPDLKSESILHYLLM